MSEGKIDIEQAQKSPACAELFLRKESDAPLFKVNKLCSLYPIFVPVAVLFFLAFSDGGISLSASCARGVPAVCVFGVCFGGLCKNKTLILSA